MESAPPRPDPHDHIRITDRPAVVWAMAAGWMALGAVLLALPFVVAAQNPPPRGAITRDLALALGFAALALVGFQFALTGRLRPLLHPFGADIVMVFHRYVSWGALALMLGHFGILYIWHEPDLGRLNPFVAPAYMTAGRVALLCFGALVVTSQLRKRLGLGYLWWRWLHLGLALTGFGAAIYHALGAGHFTGTGAAQRLWLGVTLAWLGLVAYTRLWRPWQQRRNPWRVVANEAQGAGVRRLTLRPEGRALRGWRPGQFAWLAINRSPFGLREHPFTISSAPEDGPEISFTIKPLGDDSRRLTQASPGDPAYVDGPFGMFTIDRHADAAGFVMIAGGVGITPVIANLSAMARRGDRRPVTLIYANPQWDEIACRDTLDDLAAQIDLHLVHVLEDASGASPAAHATVAQGMIDADLLARHLPDDTRDWPHMLCGPAPMIAAARKGLGRLGVARHRIENEIFELA